ncbi:MAG: type I-G CRISPR-associated helicase/endonuclease Cas3g, partial [Candidatus Acidiferrales bacterium]
MAPFARFMRRESGSFMVTLPSFSEFFQALWTYEPFPWQRMLAERLAEGEWPRALDLPTAAGKTACIDVAIYALAAQAGKPVWESTAPRRIWFAVDRRIVVDEAFDRAQEIAAKLRDATGRALNAVADRLREVSGTDRPLAVGRLRGGVLRDDGWARLPSQPAVITSTVDQLGSRLLFRGYGRSALTAPIFAGLAAHDSLILLDEAHLSVPFMQTLNAVERYRGEEWAEQPISTPFAFSILSATPPPDIAKNSVFPGVDRDAALDHPELTRRINASKPAELVLVKAGRLPEKDSLVETAAERATAFVKQKRRKRVAVIVNRVFTAESVARSLREQCGGEIDVVLLTGRLRPFERDQLVTRWKPVLKASKPDEPEGPVVLVTTQCIEVGADFSFDALVTEAASLDALRQRFGRLNRLGRFEPASAVILIRDEDAKAGAEDFVYGTALAECWRLLQELAEPRTDENRERKVVDFGIAAFDARLQGIDDLAPYLAPVLDAPLLLPSHIDLLCQTSPRPQVEPGIQLYLHGVGRGAPEIRVAWRADLVENDTDNWPETVALCPPNSAETVAVPLYQLRQWLADETDGDDSSDVEGARDSEFQTKERIRPVLLWQGRERSRVCSRASQLSPNDVVILPAAYGMEGLGQSAPGQAVGQAQLDIWEPSHAQSGKPVALRLHREVLKPWLSCPPLQSLMELVEEPAWERESVREAIGAALGYKQDSEDNAPVLPDWLLAILDQVRDGRYEQHPAGGLVLRARKAESQEEEEQDLFADDDDLLSATGQEVSLGIHSASVERAADKLARHCLPDEFREPLKTAAYWHDVGKLDERFQVMLRQGNELAMLTGTPLAKSAAIPDSPARRRAIRLASGLPDDFRHEMLSLQLAERSLPNWDNAALDELLLHAIASHHGYGRPFAPISLDPAPPPVRGVHGGVTIEASTEERGSWPAVHAPASGISTRFWRLTRRYGWWGLAYLEAILRLSDWYGSRWVVDKASEKTDPTSKLSLSKVAGSCGKSCVLEGVDGANPLGFLAAVGALVVLHQAGHRESRMAWRRNGLAWRPHLTGLRTDDQTLLSELLAENLRAASVSEKADEKRKEAEQLFAQKKKEIKDKRDEIKKRGLRGKERKQALEEEVAPFERELEVLRRTWLEALHQSVARPELALGKNIDCTEPEYRAIAEPLLVGACYSDRESLDLLAAFCSVGCLHESPAKRKDGKLAPTPFSFISGSGHQNFLDTAGMLLQSVSPKRVESLLFASWT